MNSQDGWQGRNATRPGRRALMPEDKENGAGNQSSESEERLRKRLRRLKRRMRNEDRGWRAGAIAALVLIAVAILVSGHHRHHHHRPPSGMAAAAQQRRWSRAVRAHQARAREADSSKCQAAKVGAKSRWFARYSTIAIERPLNLRLVPACPVKSPGAPGSIARAFVQSAQKPIRPDS